MISVKKSPRRLLTAAVAVAVAVSITLLLSSYYFSTTTTTTTVSVGLHCPSKRNSSLDIESTEAILHYATSRITPQQTAAEIRISLDVLLRRRPCNFLVFGLGHDSRMWSAFNAGGRTLFLEEDPQWVRSVLKDAPQLRAVTVRYRTQLKEADALLRSYKEHDHCRPPKAFVQGNRLCKLALGDLPVAVYEEEWDLIMIDAPRGYFPEAPGRMAAIWTAAVMARNRRGEGHTDVFLHDVDRKVEKEFAREFLCKKYRVAATGRLWHFRIPPAAAGGEGTGFC